MQLLTEDVSEDVIELGLLIHIGLAQVCLDIMKMEASKQALYM